MGPIKISRLETSNCINRVSTVQGAGLDQLMEVKLAEYDIIKWGEPSLMASAVSQILIS